MRKKVPSTVFGLCLINFDQFRPTFFGLQEKVTVQLRGKQVIPKSEIRNTGGVHKMKALSEVQACHRSYR